jgi:hypothetical protein
MATIRQNIIDVIGPKLSTTGEGNGVKSYTPQIWLVNDTDLFQIKPFLIDNDFTDQFYNVSTKEYLVWDSKFNFFKPLNGSTENIFSGSGDIVFFQDEFCEIRWNTSDDQPQFRLKGNIGWFDISYMLTPGNSSSIRNDSQDISTHNDLLNWSSWFYWSNNGLFVNQNRLGVYGGQGDYFIMKEDIPSVGETILPTYKLTLMKGNDSRITAKVERILEK